MEKKITIRDIAKLANVSVGTVDRVIHNRGEVAEDSRKRVMDIIEKTGYQPNLIARTLGINKTFNIAAILPDPNQDEYWGMATDGVDYSREEWGLYGVRIKLFHFNLYEKASYESCANEVLSLSPDGILTAPIFYQEALTFAQECHARKIPFVLMNNDISKANPLSFIGQDLYQSGRVAAELLELHNRPGGVYAILHVYDDIHHSVHLYEKEQGFKDYFSELKHPQVTVKSLDLNYTHEPTLEKEFNELLSQENLRGLLVTTSKGASVVSRLLEKHGKKGIRLVAYDLLKENLAYLKKGIIDFLINQNSKRQASLGITQLANHLVFKKEAPETCLFPLEIVSRQNLKSYMEADFR